MSCCPIAILIRNHYVSLSPSRVSGSLLRKLMAWLRSRRRAVPNLPFERIYLEVIPARRHLRPSDTLYKKIIKFSIMDCSTYNARIDLAVADLHQQEKPNFKATARKHIVNNTTLKRRYQGRQLSKQAASSEYRQYLTFAQEETLIGLINSLTDRGIPPTSQIIRNLA